MPNVALISGLLEYGYAHSGHRVEGLMGYCGRAEYAHLSSWLSPCLNGKWAPRGTSASTCKLKSH